MVSRNIWKYTTIGLLSVLALGVSFPQAFAHVTNNVQHTLGHVMDALAGIQSDVNEIQQTTEDIEQSIGFKMLKVSIARDVPEATSETIEILPPVEGTGYRGHLELTVFESSGNRVELHCGTAQGNLKFPILVDPNPVERDFSCFSLDVTFTDEFDGDDADDAAVTGMISYAETEDVSELVITPSD